MEVSHIKNGKYDGTSTSYIENGNMHSERKYVNGKLISGKCKDGRAWTEAEMENWNNGLDVYCN